MSDVTGPDFDVSKSLSMLFGTPLVAHQWPDSDALNEALNELILGKEAEQKKLAVRRSNAGGWQTAGNLIGWKEPCIHTVKLRIETLVGKLLGELVRKDGSHRSFRFLIDAWANVCRQGDYNVVHTHPNCMWSGIYYVAQGERDSSVPYGGLLELLDPREAANYLQVQNTVLDARHFIENTPGLMLLFPSWLKHMVHPYVGKGARGSIAFNVNVVEQSPP
jgi:uncharacterized protein (TIGR02466 family)